MSRIENGLSALYGFRRKILYAFLIAALAVFSFYVLIDLFLPCSSPLWLRFMSVAYGSTLSPFWAGVDHACYSIAGPLGLINYRDPSTGIGLHAELSFAAFIGLFSLDRKFRSRSLSEWAVDTFLLGFGTAFIFELLLLIFAAKQTVCLTGVCVGESTWSMTVTIDLYMRGLSWVTNGLVFEITLPVVSFLLFVRFRPHIWKKNKPIDLMLQREKQVSG